MRPTIWLWLLVVAFGVATADDESTPVFRSDVSMGRIDTLVMDRSQHPIGGLRKEDFLLRQDGKLIPIRNLAHVRAWTMECLERSQLRCAFEDAVAAIDRIIDRHGERMLLCSNEGAAMAEVSLAIVRRDLSAEALLHHMVEHLCGGGEDTAQTGARETRHVVA